jgi:K+-sensing histidine kinase KdpD
VAVALMGLHKLGRAWRAVIAASMALLVTAAFLPFREHLNPTEVALTLLLVVLFAATLFGSVAGLAASVFGILCFNFFFLPPYGTLTISDPENWVAFGAFVITALIAGQISGYARRRAEESEARQHEIERLYDELRAAFEQASEAEALRRSEKLKSALLDAVTHDLRTPLTSIKASVTTLLEDAKEAMLDGESRGEFLEIIDEETDRLDEFIEGMVGIAKIEAGAMNLAKRPSPMDEIVTNALQRAEKILGDRRVEVRMPAGPPNVYADAVSVAEVLFTLVDNAARYSAAGTQMRVTVEQRDGSVEIAVEDQGKGIPLKMRGRIFDKFVRLDEQDIHRTGSGLGLGLAIAKGIVESQGGTITVGDGSDGFATRFAVTLPAAEA